MCTQNWNENFSGDEDGDHDEKNEEQGHCGFGLRTVLNIIQTLLANVGWYQTSTNIFNGFYWPDADNVFETKLK